MESPVCEVITVLYGFSGSVIVMGASGTSTFTENTGIRVFLPVEEIYIGENVIVAESVLTGSFSNQILSSNSTRAIPPENI